ncbi:MAG: endo alpha-1,4 polygalactosaminidase [Thermodesulfobacteriota bacterium]|nr:endo alpha-1,4 polygalactosaminidase [Thermodesulfobacteriota bacterium]
MFYLKMYRYFFIFFTFFILTSFSGAEESMLLDIMPPVLAASHTKHGKSWWQPKPGTSWQWQLSGPINTSVEVDMYDIDLFETPQSTIDKLHNDGRIVICYLSAGSWEEYRPDKDDYPESILGNTLDGWPDERWVDIRRLDTLGPILEARMDLAVSKNCDGIEPDNIDGYTNDNGFSLTPEDQLIFNRWLASEAHKRGLSIGLKNDLNQIEELVEYFDWALNEQCFQYKECETLKPFIQAGKAVFGVEYNGSPDTFCPKADELDFDWLKKSLNLDDWRYSCR